jgi:hypothetical protein
MNTFRIDLDFSTGEPTSQVARIYVKRSFPADGGLPTYLSADCASASELDVAVERLKAELDEIRKQGRKRFADEHRKPSTPV